MKTTSNPPKKGTMTRQAYDALKAGKPINPFNLKPNQRYNLVKKLRNDYGLNVKQNTTNEAVIINVSPST